MTDEICLALADAIIMQAVQDWRRLVRKNAHSGSYTELRRFFKSDWCAELCRNANPLFILGQLEEERKAVCRAKQGGK